MNYNLCIVATHIHCINTNCMVHQPLGHIQGSIQSIGFHQEQVAITIPMHDHCNILYYSSSPVIYDVPALYNKLHTH